MKKSRPDSEIEYVREIELPERRVQRDDGPRG